MYIWQEMLPIIMFFILFAMFTSRTVVPFLPLQLHDKPIQNIYVPLLWLTSPQFSQYQSEKSIVSVFPLM